LKVLRSACPNLCAEARLYRYPSPSERALLGEQPIDDHNHALAALRYLIAQLDARFLGRLRKHAAPAADEPEIKPRTSRSLANDHLWTPLG
jgi:hypothetical protein